ncbi:MAG: zinc ribbon domain-containing protein [Polyangiales bacterium]
MPLYDYRCPKCQSVSELLVSHTASPTCPQCGDKLERLLSAPVPPGRTKDLVKRARALAASEGHFSNYAPSERPKR